MPVPIFDSRRKFLTYSFSKWLVRHPKWIQAHGDWRHAEEAAIAHDDQPPFNHDAQAFVNDFVSRREEHEKARETAESTARKALMMLATDFFRAQAAGDPSEESINFEKAPAPIDPQAHRPIIVERSGR